MKLAFSTMMTKPESKIASDTTVTTADLLRNITTQMFWATTAEMEDSRNHSFVVAQSVCRLIGALSADHTSALTQMASELGFSQQCFHPEASAAVSTLAERLDSLRSLKHSASIVLQQRSCGRIVVVLALYVEMCRKWICQEQELSRQSEGLRCWITEDLAEDFAAFLDDHLGEWVATQGGWNCLAVRATPKSASPSSCVSDATEKTGSYRNILSYAVMGMGISTLLGLMVVR
ncbi:hypothetical protein BV898_08743 [Hypsibius exemplaris]|uniref:Uncharacterized protein n=1 Tax=Hypsibius exemplaris TaxID=2072580 RepID=A0A1W0WPU0_HYPEX|nr:hypothetical protein BV898_08743 [Hypsibius exemplaris]